VGEIVIGRDERGRIVELTFRPEDAAEPARTSALHLMRAVVESLREYLHVEVGSTFGEHVSIEIDRRDQYLDREIDAVLVTAVHGLRIVEREFPDELIVSDASVEAEVSPTARA
jgi:uncharacterized protein (DUF2267 family)